MPRKQTSPSDLDRSRPRHAPYDPAVAEHLLDLMERMSIVKAAAEAGIPERAVYEWRDSNADFAQRFARARLVRIERLGDEIVDVADGCQGYGRDGAAEARVRVEARRIAIEREKPKRISVEGQLSMEHTFTGLLGALDDEA